MVSVRIGVPREVKNHEYRVALTPAGVQELTAHGHDVVIEADAGVGSAIPDRDFVAAGAKMLATADEVWESADLILKVKEPVAQEYDRLRAGQVLFTYLHLAASRECTDALLDHRVTSIAYETVEKPDHSLPLLAPINRRGHARDLILASEQKTTCWRTLSQANKDEEYYGERVAPIPV